MEILIDAVVHVTFYCIYWRTWADKYGARASEHLFCCHWNWCRAKERFTIFFILFFCPFLHLSFSWSPLDHFLFFGCCFVFVFRLHVQFSIIIIADSMWLMIIIKNSSKISVFLLCRVKKHVFFFRCHPSLLSINRLLDCCCCSFFCCCVFLFSIHFVNWQTDTKINLSKQKHFRLARNSHRKLWYFNIWCSRNV